MVCQGSSSLLLAKAKPVNLLSGSNTPLESMPPLLRTVMSVSPSTHFVSYAQAILFRGAGFGVVWKEFAAVAAIGSIFFALALLRFRSVVSQASRAICGPVACSTHPLQRGSTSALIVHGGRDEHSTGG
jgi:hypothetical protein